MERRIKALKRAMRRHPWRTVAVFIIGFVFLSVYIIYHYEGKVNPEMTFFDAVRTVLVFFLGEYADTPKTLIGRVISVLLFVLGIGLVGTFIGKVSSVFIGWKLEVKMPGDLEDHIVICNWSDRGDRIIKELHSPMAVPDKEIVVISDYPVDEEELRINHEYENVFFVKSDPTSHDVLRKAQAHCAVSVILLADPECADPDAKNALIALAISKLEKEVVRPPHIVAEVIDHNKKQHLIDAGVDEWVCATEYGLGILAQCALYGKLSEVYQQLLTYSESTNEIYLLDKNHFPQSFIGKTFKEIADILNNNRNSGNPAILLGVKRDGDDVILNPRGEQFDALREDDFLILVAFDQPDLTAL